MKQRKLLTLILGIAIFAGILCSGIIITTGIQAGNTSIRNTKTVKEHHPKPHILKKTKIEEFSEASLYLENANVTILPSDDFYLEYRLDGTSKEPEYDISNGTLYFQEGDTLEQYRISFHLFGYSVSRDPFYLNLYVPKDQYFTSLLLSMESGNADIEQLNAKKAELYLSYGNLNLKEFTGTTLNISAESGNIESEHISCDDLSISSSYGNVTGNTVSVLKRADLTLESENLELSQLAADTLFLNASYGSCKIHSIDNQKGTISMESGNLVLKSAALKTMDISSEYGNVTLQLADEPSSYNYNLKTEYGAIDMDGKTVKEDEDGTVLYQKQEDSRTGSIQVRCESGNVDIR